MRKVLVIILAVVLISFSVCYIVKSLSQETNKIEYVDISNENKEYGEFRKEGTIEITSVKAHSGEVSNQMFIKNCYSYDKIDIIRDGSNISIYYNEKQNKEKCDVFISFNTGIMLSKENTQLYKNEELVTENINYIIGIE